MAVFVLSKTRALLLALAALGVAAVAEYGVPRASATPQAQPKTAAENYKSMCATCHMADGTHLIPEMSFSDGKWNHGSTVKEIQKVIANGVVGTAMKPFEDRLSEKEILELAKYVRAFDKQLEPEESEK